MILIIAWDSSLVFRKNEKQHIVKLDGFFIGLQKGSVIYIKCL